jgi:hypothetical protein
MLNNTWVTRSQIFTAGGRHDVELKGYRFPDGSAGRVIKVRRRGIDLPPRMIFIELKTVGASKLTVLRQNAI